MMSSDQYLNLRGIKLNIYIWKKELFKNASFIYFRQVFQKVWQYKYNLTIMSIKF